MESQKTAVILASPDITPLFETLGFWVYPTDKYSPQELYDLSETVHTMWDLSV